MNKDKDSKSKKSNYSSNNTSGTITPVEERKIFINYFNQSLINDIAKLKNQKK